MDKGKVLKIRVGHEANCSSGMVVVYILMVAAVTHLPLSLIAASAQAAKLNKDAPRKERRLRYWLIPQILGLVCTAFMVWLSFDSFYGYSSDLAMLALAIGGSFALAITIGYFLAARMRSSGWVVLIVPLAFVLGVVLFIAGVIVLLPA